MTQLTKEDAERLWQAMTDVFLDGTGLKAKADRPKPDTDDQTKHDTQPARDALQKAS